MDMLDVTISLVIVLFILSIVTEKFTQLIRGYPLFFNAIALVFSAVCIWRGIYCFLCPPSGNGEGNPLIAVILFLLSFLVFFIRSGSRYSVLPFPVFVISNLLAAIFAYSYVLYFLVGCLVAYLCLVGLKLLPEYRIRVSNKTFTTNLLKRVRSTNRSLTLIRDADKKNEIHVLSLIVGIIVAYLFKADFFELIKNFSQSEGKSIGDLGWSQFPISFGDDGFKFGYETYTFDFYFTLGLLLTGFFLSFGSRFFHDLLETLFYVKKAKYAVADRETYEINEVQKLEAWVKTYDIERFYDREKRRISGQLGLLGIGIGTVRSNGETVTGLRLYGTDAHKLVSERFEVDGREIPYEFIKMDRPKVSNGEIEISFYDGITNIAPGHAVGSITCAVQASRRDRNWTATCLLTCYHVVKHKEHAWDQFTSGKFAHASLSRSPNIKIGRIIAGCRTSFVEIALIELNEDYRFMAEHYGALGIKETRRVDEKDRGMGVYHYSRIGEGEKRKGIIQAYKSHVDINFKDNKGRFYMDELIEVQQSDTVARPIQEYGDSGNLLFDEHGWPIGIIFAKSAESTFAMRMQQVVWRLENLGFTIKLL